MARWIRPDINIDFIGQRKRFFALSTTAVVVSLGGLLTNTVVRGDALNYGTDFKGGSQIQIEFSRKASSAGIRAALNRGGFKGAEVIKVEDEEKPNLFMLRLSEVSSFSAADQKTVEKSLDKTFHGQVKKVDYKDGSDKIYLRFGQETKVDAGDGAKAIADQVSKVFASGGIDAQQVQLFGRPEDRTFEVQLSGLGGKLTEVLNAGLGKQAVKDIPQVETVGAKMGRQLRDEGVKSVLYAMILMLVYIAIRFDFRYAPGAIIALVHDVIITVGLFAVTWTEFSLPIVAALLTIAGYSINDTIVVFDRIRENVARLRDRKFPLVVNAAINETLGRTLLTSLTTLFTCVAIWALGTGVLRTFAFALTAGIVVGTYSSICVASPIVIMLNERFSVAKRRARAR